MQALMLIQAWGPNGLSSPGCLPPKARSKPARASCVWNPKMQMFSRLSCHLSADEAPQAVWRQHASALPHRR